MTNSKETLKEALGRRLRECRINCKMSQRQVANMLGVSQPVYQRFEKGTYECSYQQLADLCRVFDVSADYLLGVEIF